ncbi:heat shock protein Hsp-12.2-like [Physella acuta]|uniref:heat shock protein Hsp-12.2-like n=1 Tax=Physella acuta TaxID=109671 RepID=UPI0027DB6EE2|nr:heat shock protein Hsp-12.2-like [Physella acuta]
MFAISPRYTDDNSLFRLVDDLVHPWDVYRSPLFNNREGALSQNSGRLGDSEIQNTDKEFRIRLDLRHYSPEEVKITSDNKKITIKAKHEEKQDNHGFVSREMIRTYALPDDVDAKSVTSTMNSQGTLSIRAAKKAIEPPKETAIPVEFKG